ncbi:DEAD/DEAH box helicase [Candidatus Pacearchaeota archaeon]|nr:DEAD/DEAH box helicase [Candidatus Pacearchaeota archaeon]
MEQFAKLGFSTEVLSVLKEAGFKTPTKIQEKTIPLAIAGRDIIGGSATGSGKTLAFASPIIENLKADNHIQALILTPTRELAEQVADSIALFSKNKNLNVLAVYGGVDMGRQVRALYRTDILVGTPGRILDHIQRRTLRLNHVKFLVLDEVDRMLDMGFHKDVEAIIKECPKERQTMLFSATISADLDYLAKKYTKNPENVMVESFVDHSKLEQIYYDVPSSSKFSLLVHLLKKKDSELIMIFCSTRHNADFVAENLNNVGIKARAIHGGLVQNKRLNILREFHEKRFNVLVCTDVAARGLDIKGVSHVYNYDMPKVATDYIHRIGRTARAGQNGKIVNILASRDYENFSNILRDDSIKISQENLPSFETIHIRVNFARREGNSFQRRGNERNNNSRFNNRSNRQPRWGNKRR